MKEFVKSAKSVWFLIALNTFLLFIGTNGINWAGAPIILIGGYIYLYNRHQMKGVWSLKVEKKKHLITNGLFKYVRHPLYLGVLITVIGLVVLTLNLWLLTIFIFIDMPYIFYRALIEEELLSKALKGYKAYMKRTKRFFPKIEIN